MTIEYAARTTLVRNGRRASRTQIASDTSPPPLRPASRSPITPATTPPMASTSTRLLADAPLTPSRNVPMWYDHARCCTACSSSISAAPPMPAPMPISTTSTQKRRP